MSAPAPKLSGLWLVIALTFAVAAACADAGRDAGQHAHGAGVYVEASWLRAREAEGHHVHVVQKQIECTKCHELTGDSMGSVDLERCAACHEKEARIEHARPNQGAQPGSKTRADCRLCHAFTPAAAGGALAPRGHPASDCKRCHAQHQGKTPGVVVHASNECLRCHRPHEPGKPQSAPCPVCHADVSATHAQHGRDPTAVCTDCHRHQHAPASEARTSCIDCHARQKPVIPKSAVFAEGHTECVGCHRPHEFGRAKAVPCQNCHQDVHVLGMQRVRQHAECTSCHSPHDVSGSPERACAGCHRDKQPDHPRRGVAGTCVGCHDPHPTSARADTRVRNCSSCHQIAGSERDFHGGTPCQKCHKPHDFVLSLAEKPGCNACHAKQLELVAALPGHQACQGCHAGLPHRPAALAAGCDSCHAKQQSEVTRGHAECTSCHEPHGGTSAASCRSCHAGEHRSAPAGHQDCQSCHQPHGGSVKAACSSCHGAEAKTPHGQRAPSCASCHRAHGPAGPAKPPECSTCHATRSLPGLHAEPKHQQCSRCHTGHGEPAPDSLRAGCLSCHADRKNHFPDAPRCNSCHLFDKTR